MSKQIVRTRALAAPIGPFSAGVIANGFVFVSGQIGRDKDGAMSEDVAVQTEQTIANIRAVLEAAGATLQDVVKVSVFLTDLAWFARMNEVYRKHFDSEQPVRTTVGVTLVQGAKVEMDAIAALG